MVVDAGLHGRRDVQRLVHPGEVVVHEVQGHREHVLLDRHAEAVVQPREPRMPVRMVRLHAPPAMWTQAPGQACRSPRPWGANHLVEVATALRLPGSGGHGVGLDKNRIVHAFAEVLGDYC